MRGPGRRGANQTVALPAQAELFRRRPERIHHGNVAELAPRLEILAQQVSAVLGFSRSDDQAVPVRNARLVHPKPRAVERAQAEARRIPDRKSTRLNSSHLGISYA